ACCSPALPVPVRRPAADPAAAPAGCSCDRLEELRRFGDSAEYAALHLHHLQRREMIAEIGGAGAILQQKAFETAIIGLTHGRVHAYVGGDSGQHDVVDAALRQDQLEVGGTERALARLVDDRLA